MAIKRQIQQMDSSITSLRQCRVVSPQLLRLISCPYLVFDHYGLLVIVGNQDVDVVSLPLNPYTSLFKVLHANMPQEVRQVFSVFSRRFLVVEQCVQKARMKVYLVAFRA